MAKIEDRRDALLDKLADHVLSEGLAASTLRPLAKAAQTSDRMLLYYFKDKSDMIAAILEHVAARLVALLDNAIAPNSLALEPLIRALVPVICADRLWPYMRLWLEIAARAAHGDPLYRATGNRIAQGFLAWGAAQLDSPTAQAREADAARLLVMIEGMLLLKSVGLDDAIERAFSTQN